MMELREAVGIRKNKNTNLYYKCTNVDNVTIIQYKGLTLNGQFTVSSIY